MSAEAPIRLFHFSEDPHITSFVPRPVLIPSPRPPGQDWLNGPLVWSIDAYHQTLYFFPRECPRILLWPIASTTLEDREKWFGETSSRMIAYIERTWLDRLNGTTLYRYEMPTRTFQSLGDAGMWVSKRPITPSGMSPIRDLRAALLNDAVALRAIDDLAPLREAWSSSLHVSGIRLRNAHSWTVAPSA